MSDSAGFLFLHRDNKKPVQRLCLLNKTRMLVYKQDSYKEGEIVINFSDDTTLEEDTQDYAFTISNNNSSYTFSTTNSQEYKIWFKLINDCIISHIQVKPNDFMTIGTIGCGKYGKVKLCVKKNTCEYYAIKSIPKQKLTKIDKIFQERNAMIQLSSPFIVHLHYAFQTERKFYLCMEYIPGGSLFEHMKKSGILPIQQIKLLVAEIAVALKHIHESGFVYLDLKPENILLDQDGHIKLSDFGLSIVCHKISTINDVVGTYEYLAPESITRNEFGKESDWWALGILIYEMVFKTTPFFSVNKERILSKITNTNIIFPGHVDNNIISLIRGLTVKDPAQRWGFNEIFAHPLFKSFDPEKVENKMYKPDFIPHSRIARNFSYDASLFTDGLLSEVLQSGKFNQEL